MPKSKRLCEICGMPLSHYNDDTICFHHQDGMIVHRHCPITLFTSYDDTPSDSIVPKPGTERYNAHAFDVVVDGVISNPNNNKKGVLHEI